MNSEQLKEFSLDALCVINAGNISGVTRDLLRKLDVLVEENDLPNHPIMVLYIQAIENMSGCWNVEPIYNDRPFITLVREFVEYVRMVCTNIKATDAQRTYPPVKTYVAMLLHHVPNARGWKYSEALTQVEQWAGRPTITALEI